MEDYNLEINIDRNRLSENFEKLVTEYIKDRFKLNHLIIQKNISLPGDNILLSFIHINSVIKVSENVLREITKLINKINSNDYFISVNQDYNKFIKKKYPNENFSYLDKLMYVKDVSSDSSIVKFLEENKFDVFCPDKKENYNIYLDIEKIDNFNCYKLVNQFDKENIIAIQKSKLLKFPYYNQEILTKYIMLLSLAKTGKELNLSCFSLKNIVQNLENKNFIETVDYYSYSLITKHSKIENFQYETFDILENAIAFNITLSDKNIHGILIPHMFKFHVCYQNFEKIDVSYKIEDSKNLLIEKIPKEMVEKYEMKKRNLFDLVNMFRINDEYIFEDFQGLFTEKNNYIPLESFMNRGLYFFNIFDDLLKTEKNNYNFDRSNMEIMDEIVVNLDEKVDFIYVLSIKYKNKITLINDNLYLDGDDLEFKKIIKFLWSKGYFLTEFGINRFIKTGKIEEEDIRFPEWFKAENEESYQWLFSNLKNLKNSLK